MKTRATTSYNKGIPAHCDIAWNEHAEFLAKKAALVIQRPTRISAFDSLRHFTNTVFKYNSKMEATELSKDKNEPILNENPYWVPGAPRKAAVPNLKL
ncbi:hypothetical protein TNCV_4864621 [Trichonephila clavipes]|nr:hypothetical protein TNCV_4864621 [Trichonephila clavipes]